MGWFSRYFRPPEDSRDDLQKVLEERSGERDTVTFRIDKNKKSFVKGTPTLKMARNLLSPSSMGARRMREANLFQSRERGYLHGGRYAILVKGLEM